MKDKLIFVIKFLLQHSFLLVISLFFSVFAFFIVSGFAYSVVDHDIGHLFKGFHVILLMLFYLGLFRFVFLFLLPILIVPHFVIIICIKLFTSKHQKLWYSIVGCFLAVTLFPALDIGHERYLTIFSFALLVTGLITGRFYFWAEHKLLNSKKW